MLKLGRFTIIKEYVEVVYQKPGSSGVVPACSYINIAPAIAFVLLQTSKEYFNVGISVTAEDINNIREEMQ